MLYTNINNYKLHRFVNMAVYKFVTPHPYSFNNTNINVYDINNFVYNYTLPTNRCQISYYDDDRILYTAIINNYIGLYAYTSKDSFSFAIELQVDTKYRHRSLINKIGSLFFRLLRKSKVYNEMRQDDYIH